MVHPNVKNIYQSLQLIPYIVSCNWYQCNNPAPLTQLKCRALLKGPIFALHCDRKECKDTALTVQGQQG